MATKLQILHHGSMSMQTRDLAKAMNMRFQNRSLGHRKVPVTSGPMVLTKDLLDDFITCAWAMGVQRTTLAVMEKERIVPVGVARYIRDPSSRPERAKKLGRKRIAKMRLARKKRQIGEKRKLIVAKAKLAAANYRKDPGAYHYLAGGKANLIYLKPTPRDWRSDCSQFIASVYADCGIESPGDVSHLWVNTWAVDRKCKVTTRPRPGDFGMYGPRGNPHHMELCILEPGTEFIGHGSPPIDSVTPGRPDYYLTLPGLD